MTLVQRVYQLTHKLPKVRWTHDSEPIKYTQLGSEIREGGLLPRVCTMRLGTWV